MKKITLLTAITFCILFTKLYAQVGIGTATPDASTVLHVDVGASTTKGLLISGTYNSSAMVPNLGAGTRLMFYPGKSVFRAGFVDGTQWNDGFVGSYSTAMGYGTTASGDYSTAMGSGTIASGTYSTAIGNLTAASGDYSNAMGVGTIASGGGSTAMGYYSEASGTYSIAMGIRSIASGYASTAMGVNASNKGHAQSFCIGGGTNINNIYPMVSNNADNQMMMYFDNYTFYSDVSGHGVALQQNGNSWVSICDKNRKENLEPLNGEAILRKLSAINFTSWNYKKQDPKSYRHYGIMAQDFNTAFGKDKYGVIGNDTTVNPIDMIGIDMAAIQALVKRTNELKDKDEAINKKLAEVTDLKKDNEKLNNQSVAQKIDIENLKNQFAVQKDDNENLKKDNENLRQSVAQLQIFFNEQQKIIAKSIKQMEALTIKQTMKEPVAIK